jgi:hypothetical protein
MFDSVEIPVTTRITIPLILGEHCVSTGAKSIVVHGADGHFAEEIPAGPEEFQAMLSRLYDFLTRNAKVELIQG